MCRCYRSDQRSDELWTGVKRAQPAKIKVNARIGMLAETRITTHSATRRLVRGLAFFVAGPVVASDRTGETAAGTGSVTMPPGSNWSGISLRNRRLRMCRGPGGSGLRGRSVSLKSSLLTSNPACTRCAGQSSIVASSGLGTALGVQIHINQAASLDHKSPQPLHRVELGLGRHHGDCGVRALLDQSL
jgi:hypothetical protein